MTITLQQCRRFAAALLLFSFAMVSGLPAQDRAVSVGVTSANLASAPAEQASPQQPGADVPPQPGPKQLTNYVEAGGDYLGLTNNFGYWAGGYARGVVTQGNNIWNAEVNGQNEFGDAGV